MSGITQTTGPVATAAVSTTSAANTTITLTIPAAAAGLFNYLVHLEIMVVVSASFTGTAAPIAVTSTGITGTPTFYLGAGTSAVVGAILDRTVVNPSVPIKGSAAATAMTFVAPAAGAGGLITMRAFYYQDV